MMILMLCLSFLTPDVLADGNDAAMVVHRIEIETADRIQTQILNPILGPGRSSVFVNLSLETTIEDKIRDTTGVGGSVRTKKKFPNLESEETNEDRTEINEIHADFNSGSHAPTSSTNQLPSKTTGPMQVSSDTIRSGDSTEIVHTQEARHIQGENRRYNILSLSFPTFAAVILHDSRLSAEKLKAAREAIIAAYNLKPDANIRFVPVEISRPK